MKSIKPGRGPSAIGAMGSVFAIIFGIFWTILAFSITRDAPFPLVGTIFPLFGVAFIFFGIVQAVYHYKNATGKQRMSILDITDENEEPDPLNQYFGSNAQNGNDSTERSNRGNNSPPTRIIEGAFCPFCGTNVSQDFNFCPKCGKDI